MGKNIRHSVTTREFDSLLETLRETRTAAGVSQRELARRLGLEETVVGKVERGSRLLDVLEFIAYAEALGIEPVELLGSVLDRIKPR